MSTSETRAVLVGIVVVALVGLAALARWYRNRRLNARDDAWRDADEREVLLLREADLGSTSLDVTDAGGSPDRVVAGAQGLSLDPAGLDQPREDRLDDEWADQLAAMNAEHLNVAEHLERVHARPWWGLECDCETFEDHERAEWARMFGVEELWVDLARDDARLVSQWIGRRGPLREGDVPSAAGWPSDDWRGEMIPA